MSQTSSTSPAIPPGTTEKESPGDKGANRDRKLRGVEPGTTEKEGTGHKGIFRKAALERLSSPEQLDYLMSITSPASWLALSAIGAISLLILLWGVFGSIPDKVAGKGILIRGGAVFDVASGADGIVLQLLVKPGDRVRKGQDIAIIGQSTLELKILLERAKLEDLKAQDKDITAREDQTNQAQLKALADEQTSRETMIKDLSSQAAALSNQVKNQEELQQKGLMTQAAVLQARNNLYSVQTQISQSEVRLSEIVTERVKMARETQEKRNQRKKEIDESARQLKEYTTEHDWTTRVKTPYSGLVIEKLVERGSPVGAKDRIVTIETEEYSMQAVIYIPAGDGKKVRKDMEIQIAPSTVKPEEYGFILGKVTGVSLFPSTPDGMERVLRNEQLVKELSRAGSPIEVTADLFRDPNTRSGYRWSSPLGPPIGIFSGTLCNGNIVVDRKRPVEFVVPKIKETLGL